MIPGSHSVDRMSRVEVVTTTRGRCRVRAFILKHPRNKIMVKKNITYLCEDCNEEFHTSEDAEKCEHSHGLKRRKIYELLCAIDSMFTHADEGVIPSPRRLEILKNEVKAMKERLHRGDLVC